MTCELRVQSVDSLDEEHVVAVKAQRAVALYASSEIERVGREVYLLSGEKSTEVGVEQFEVKGVEAFVVVVAGLVEGGMLAVDEIVVERDHLGDDEIGHQLNGETFGGGGLAR